MKRRCITCQTEFEPKSHSEHLCPKCMDIGHAEAIIALMLATVLCEIVAVVWML